MSIGAILLAAGASTRLGRPKQLVQFEGSSLVRRTAQALLVAECDPVVIVTGACPESAAEIHGLNVHLVHNDNWPSGMASSLHTGLREALRLQPSLDAVLISVCDQPFVTGRDLASLMQFFHESGQPIAATQYGSTVGVPAIFARNLFADLRKLTGDEGARRIIRARAPEVARFPLENAALDVDRAEDLERLK